LCQVFDHIHISLDGIGEIYRSVRGFDGFEKVDRAIRLLIKNGIRFGINCVVSRINYDNLEELIVYLQKVGVRDILFLRLKPFGRATSMYEQSKLTPDQARDFFPKFVDLTRRYKLHSYVDCSMLPFFYYHKPDKNKMEFSGGDGCNGANEIVEISPNGQLRGCSFLSESAGYAMQLQKLWNSAACFMRYRDWRNYSPEPCLSCDYLDLCKGGCHAVAQTLKGDFYAPDPECPFVVEGGAN
jgi:radical SAM protein with 4Fe4S-binding SPASM domain